MGVLDRQIGDLKRLEEILVVLVEEGWGLFLEETGLLRRVPLVKRLGSTQPVPPPERVRRTFERLGPTFIKFGQILSQRPDLLPQAYIDELEGLTDEVEPFPSDQARQVVEEELGPIDTVFDSFEDDPLAAASIAQVHRATLPNGDEVVVKVRRPGIREQMEKDLDILRFLARQGEKHIDALSDIRAEKTVRQFARWTRDELDLRREMRNAQIFKENLADEDRVYIPDVYPDLTTEKVLVMEEVHGVKSNDADAIRAMDIDTAAVARTAVRAGLKQIIRDGFFHADPHPSNFLVGEDGRLIYLDFGMVGTFSPRMRRNLGLLLLHAINEDVDGAIGVIKRIGTVSDDADLDGLKADIEEVLALLQHTTIREQSITLALVKLARKASRRGVYMPSDVVIMGKGLLTMEGIGLAIYPDFEISDEYEQLALKLLLHQHRPTKLAKTFAIDLLQNQDLITHLPSRISDTLDGLSQPPRTTVVNEHDPAIDRGTAVGAILLLASAAFLLQSLPPRLQLYAAAAAAGLAALTLLLR